MSQPLILAPLYYTIIRHLRVGIVFKLKINQQHQANNINQTKERR